MIEKQILTVKRSFLNRSFPILKTYFYMNALLESFRNKKPPIAEATEGFSN